MSLRRALRDRSTLGQSAILAVAGGTALLLTDDQVTAILANGLSLAVVVKIAVSYAALFVVAISAASRRDHKPVRIPVKPR